MRTLFASIGTWSKMPTTTLSAAPSYLRTTRTLLTAGVWVAAFFIPADLLDALTRPHYNPLRHWISHLSLGQFGWLGSVVLLVTAALLAVYAAGLVRWRRDSGGPVRYPVVVMVSTFGLLVAALFPMAPSLGFPPDADAAMVSNVAGVVHDVAGPIFVLGVAAAAILSRHHLAVLGVPTRFARWSWAASAAVVLSYATCSVLVGMDLGGIWPGAWGGLFERLAAYTGLCWVSLTAHALSRAYRPTRTTRRIPSD
jgi:Protein of unknown function (DUF998)